ncbi:MAG TPA: hypothetical protein VKB88_44845 [Bryobacteraceae bacterium]|nr:hypothetical protein [Bryobacteraceae bacterium]
MLRRVQALPLVALALYAAPQPVSVASLISLVRNAIARHESDNKLAGALHKVWLAQRLDDRTIEELESDGAGPKSVAELLDLRDASAGQSPPVALPDFPTPPIPSRPEQDEILKAAAVNAASYSASLPDFICSEVIHRFEDIGGNGRWKPKDVLKVKLTYFERREDYQLASINNHATRQDYDYRSVGGAITEGEFGSDLVAIFRPESKTVIRWDHWTRLRKHSAHVFFYRIAIANSRSRMEVGMKGGPRESALVGEHGYFYVDRDTRQILRINRVTDPPADFPVRKATSLLDYDFQPVGGRPFLLPLRAEIRMATDYILTRNQIDFTDYRKFEGESKITFDQAK